FRCRQRRGYSGTLTAVNGTAFSSGIGATGTTYGEGTMLQFFIPTRSNNLMSGSTRINEETIGYSVHPGDFEDPFPGVGNFAGRDDEVYLTPDLWWDQLGIAGGDVFPSSANSGQGGSLAIVNDPGGLFNLEELIAGSLGASTTLYRDANGVSGAGLYTIYYDSIEPVSTVVPTETNSINPVLPPTIFDFTPDVFFVEQFESFDRIEDLLDDGFTGNDDFLFDGIGLFEMDPENSEENGAWGVENSLDNLFGERRNSFSEEEIEEEKEEKRQRAANGVGPLGLTFYIYEPGTNQYSSYRVFGSIPGDLPLVE
ncbi:MAG: hypothetical protein AAGC68_11895, partial [Verrucomicrobiota bacterium]